MAIDSISLDDARRIAVAAQGFEAPRPSCTVAMDHVRRVIRTLGLLQLDYVNVVAPAHYIVPFSRLGPYERTLLDDLVYRRREFTEQWAHEASIVPVDCWPLLRHHKYVTRTRPNGMEPFLARRAAYVESVLGEVRARGPLGAEQVADPPGESRRIPGAWVGTVPRAILETYFLRGVLGIADRRSNFSRTYDLIERVVLDADHRRPVERAQAQRELLRRASRALGVGTAADLADYFRMPMSEAKPAIAELVASGTLQPVQVEGWREPAYLDPQARRPRALRAHALIAPFDPLVWFRPRAARLFGFDYRVEIFIPQSQRRWGCYVLPFLLGDRLVARVDLRSDRPARRLAVRAAYLEAHADADATAPALAREIRTMSAWLGLTPKVVSRRGGFTRELAAALRS